MTKGTKNWASGVLWICGFRMQPCSILRSYRLTLWVNYLCEAFLFFLEETLLSQFLQYVCVYASAKVDFSTLTMGNPMPESALTLCQSRLYSPVRDLGFGLRILECYLKTTGIGFSSTTDIFLLKTTFKAEMSEVKTKSHSLESFFTIQLTRIRCQLSWQKIDDKETRGFSAAGLLR